MGKRPNYIEKKKMNEEKYLEERLAKRNPFRVPKGYFDSFAEHVIKQLPPQQKAKHVTFRPWMYAAACLVVAVFSVAIYFAHVSTNSSEMPQMAVTESYMDEAADYAMIDNTDIYACLADN